MFSKPAKSTRGGARPSLASVQLDAPAARKSAAVASMIGRDMVIEGDISGEGELHLDGVVRGDVHVERLSVGESGRVEGSVFADSVEVRGKILGSVNAAYIRLHAAAEVEGDLTHEQLTIDTGASFLGRSLRLERPPVREPSISRDSIGDVINLEAVPAA